MHEDAREVQLNLEADVHVGAVDGGGPPQREPPIGDLVQPRPLRVGQLLVLHALLKAARLWEPSTPSSAVSSLYESAWPTPHSPVF